MVAAVTNMSGTLLGRGSVRCDAERGPEEVLAASQISCRAMFRSKPASVSNRRSTVLSFFGNGISFRSPKKVEFPKSSGWPACPVAIP
ncbi:MAG: hypothetical protein RMI94_13045 [Bryobacterales bacterium]|nr:hypothetical protein [Bryobacteraceae bacterium]MDW8131470.1 hypothetical protein [Bryobacterales bacterium]